MAEWLRRNHPELQVTYPGLPGTRTHATAARVLRNGFGAILTLRAGSRERAFAIMNRLRLVYRISNIGDSRTLIIHPGSTLALENTPEERESSGVYDDLLRISLGIEDAEDLIGDLRQAIEAE